MWEFGIQQSAVQESLCQPESAGFGTPRGIVCSGREPRNSCHVWVSGHRLQLDVLHDSMAHISAEGSETQKPGMREGQWKIKPQDNTTELSYN